MSCANLITIGIGENCFNNTGGGKRVLITDKVNVTAITDTEPDGVIDTITMASTTNFYEYKFNRNGASITEELTTNFETGTSFFTQTLELSVPRRDENRRLAVDELIEGQKDLAILFQDQNQNWWLLGEINGSKVSALTGGSGKNKDEMNGYTITFTAEEPDQAKVVDPTIIDALLTPAT